MQMTKDEIFDILDDVENTKIINTEPHKYITIYTYVTKIKDRYYMFLLDWHPSDGYQINDMVELTEVEPVEVTTVEWRIK